MSQEPKATNPDNVGGLLRLADEMDDQAKRWSLESGDYAQGRTNSFCEAASAIRERYAELCRAAPTSLPDGDLKRLLDAAKLLESNGYSVCRAAPAGSDEETVREVYWMGWMNCAAWTDRYDLLADRGSNAYLMLEDDVVARYAKRDSVPAGSGEVASIVTRIERILKDSEAGHVTGLGDTCEDALNSAIELLRKLQQGADGRWSGEDAMTQELLPCPFCGCAGAVVQPEDARECLWEVVCASPSGCGAASGWNLTKDKAIAAWNTRPSAQAVPVNELELLVIDLLACEDCDDPHNDSALGNLHAYIRRRGLGDALHEATHYPEEDRTG